MSRADSRERLNQKLRTRAALLEAARSIVAEGRPLTVSGVADAAMVSRATAYRYFPTREALLVELPIGEPPAPAALFGPGAPAGAEDRAALVQNALYDLARDREAEFRIFLRASLARGLKEAGGADDPLRGARRNALLEEALAPLRGRVPEDELERLRTGLAVLVGVESMIVLRDVLRLDHDEARRAGEWAVRRLVRSVAGPG